MPGRTAKDDAFLALRGASYHLYQLREQFNLGLLTNDQHCLFHWHLRGFFWELVAVRDSLNKGTKDATIKTAVDALNAAPWFQEISAYRSFAHQSFHVVQVSAPVVDRQTGKTGKADVFMLQRTGLNHSAPADGRQQLQSYWDAMERFLKGIFQQTMGTGSTTDQQALK